MITKAQLKDIRTAALLAESKPCVAFDQQLAKLLPPDVVLKLVDQLEAKESVLASTTNEYKRHLQAEAVKHDQAQRQKRWKARLRLANYFDRSFADAEVKNA